MKYHFIGIGGVGMSALARIMLQRGHEVSGSDSKESYVTKALIAAGANIVYEHKKENIQEGQRVIYSTAIKATNPEWLAATNKMHRSAFLQELLNEKKAILVVGAHGKTTSTTLLSYAMTSLDPSFVIGGFSPSLGGINGYDGKGEYFVAEGDESDGSFLKATPLGAIITNVDFDHLDYWKTKEALLEAYKQFIQGVERPDLLFYRYEDPFLSTWKMKGVSFGEDARADLRVEHIRFQKGQQIFDIRFKGRLYEGVTLNLLGRHNVFNALACFGMAISLGVSEEAIRRAFASFKGVKRRLERKGEVQGALVYDDYAHHPKEIEATLKAIKEAFVTQKRIAVFQPHRYSRMKDFMTEFGSVWEDVDELVVTDIYSAGEEKIEGVSIEAFFKKLQKKTATYIPREKLTTYLKAKATQGDVFVMLGAGDITAVSSELVV